MAQLNFSVGSSLYCKYCTKSYDNVFRFRWKNDMENRTLLTIVLSIHFWIIFFIQIHCLSYPYRIPTIKCSYLISFDDMLCIFYTCIHPSEKKGIFIEVSTKHFRKLKFIFILTENHFRPAVLHVSIWMKICDFLNGHSLFFFFFFYKVERFYIDRYIAGLCYYTLSWWVLFICIQHNYVLVFLSLTLRWWQEYKNDRLHSNCVYATSIFNFYFKISWNFFYAKHTWFSIVHARNWSSWLIRII